jgi:hypothetical protein
VNQERYADPQCIHFKEAEHRLRIHLHLFERGRVELICRLLAVVGGNFGNVLLESQFLVSSLIRGTQMWLQGQICQHYGDLSSKAVAMDAEHLCAAMTALSAVAS